MQVGLDIVTSAICKSQLQFQQTNNYQLLYLTSSTYFQSAAARADGILIPNLHKALSVEPTSGFVQLGLDVETIIGSAYPRFGFGGRNSAGFLLVNFGFSYKFSFSSGVTVGQFNCTNPRPLVATVTQPLSMQMIL